LNGYGALPWDVLAARSLLGERVGSVRILVVGGGASTLPRTILAERPDASVDVLERNAAVVDLAREHFDTAPDEESTGRVSMRVGNLEDLLAEIRGPYDLVLVDTAALAPLGGVDGLSRSARAALLSAVGHDGALAAGPEPFGGSLTGSPAGWRATELRRVAPVGARGAHAEASEEVLVVSRPAGAEPWMDAVGDFAPREGNPVER
jgi:hypothetical protein